jgi:ParB-like chromosome segregation protein Spo0J
MTEFKADIEWVKVSSIKPYEKNYKKHPQEQIEKLALAIEKTGFDVPVILDRNLVLIAGEGRWLASRKLKLAEIPCIIRRDLTDQEANAKRIANNVLGVTSFDDVILLNELESLREQGFNMALTGFNDKDLLSLQAELEKDLVKNKKHLEKKQTELAENQMILSVKLTDENELKALYDELVSRNFKVSIFN